MIGKKMYIAMAVFLAIGGSILTWMLLYGDLPHNSPVRAKQVFNISDKANSSINSRSKFFSKNNAVNNAQTIGEVRLFN